MQRINSLKKGFSPTFLTDLIMILRVLNNLPRYLHNPLTLAECKTILRRRLEQRERDFLDLMKRSVFTNPTSPYLSLFNMAGCQYGDLERMVLKEGVEHTLHTLFKKGVYLTLDEFKGRKPIVRGNITITNTPEQLRNPLSIPHFWTSTGGSRGAATRIKLDLACIRDRAVNMQLTLEARGGANWQNTIWSTRGIAPILWYSGCGIPVERWFLQIDPKTLGIRSKFWWSTKVIAWASQFAGTSLPTPEYAPAHAPQRVIDWIVKTLRDGSVPHLWGSTSSVVRLCHIAEKAGVDLAGAHFTITGEPITGARLDAIQRVNGDALPDYGSADSGGTMSYGCLSPEAPDDVHFFSDLHALIQPDSPPFPKGALLVSSLRPTAPFILLNVSMGDRAAMNERNCGCPLERLGWRTHLHTIRSYEKLTAGGVTFEDMDVIRILEETLPHHFGGGPTDYQLIEDNGDDGQPRLRLLVNPAIGPVDLVAVSNVFLEAIGDKDENKRDMAVHWKNTGFLHIEREVPHVTESGKILHLVAAPMARLGDKQ